MATLFSKIKSKISTAGTALKTGVANVSNKITLLSSLVKQNPGSTLGQMDLLYKTYGDKLPSLIASGKVKVGTSALPKPVAPKATSYSGYSGSSGSSYKSSGAAGGGVGAYVNPTTSAQLAQSFTQPIIDMTYKGPYLNEVLPWDKFYGKFEPTLQQQASSIIDPFAARQLASTQRGITTDLARTGGGYFGRGVGRLGAAQAESERNAKSQLLDYMNTYKQKLNDYYGLMNQQWNLATEQNPGATPTLNVPTWEGLQSYL